MIRHIGSQNRENIRDTDYQYIGKFEHGGIILQDTTDGKFELWVKDDDHSGYVVEIDDVGYEFVRSVPNILYHADKKYYSEIPF